MCTVKVRSTSPSLCATAAAALELAQVERPHARHVGPDVRVPGWRRQEHERHRQLALSLQRLADGYVRLEVVDARQAAVTEEAVDLAMVEALEFGRQQRAIARRALEAVGVDLPAAPGVAGLALDHRVVRVAV